MKRILISSFALFAMVLAPAASFAQDRYCDRGQQEYRPNFPVDERYYGRDNGYYDQRNSDYAPRDYNYNRDRNGYGYSNRDRWGRSAAYIGGGAAAGAALGAIIGHGKGAGVGAIAGGLGGYLYKKHNDRRYNERGY